jgi:hypothetical protein
LLLVTLIYVPYAYAQGHAEPCKEYSGSARRDCYYELLLQRWYDGADGQKQAPIDSAVRQHILEREKNRRGWGFKMLQEERNMFDNLKRYRGLGIFLYDVNEFQYCLPLPNSVEDYVGRIDGIAFKMVKDFYNINIGINTICSKIWSRAMERNADMLIGVRGLPNDESIVFLISNITSEILSAYKYTVQRE